MWFWDFIVSSLWGSLLLGDIAFTIVWGGEWHYLVPLTTLAVRRDALQPASPPSSEGERRRPSSHQASIPGLPCEARMMPWSPTSLVHPLKPPPFRWTEFGSLVDFCWFLLICFDFYWFPLVSVDFCWFPFIFVDSFWFLLISIDFRWFPLIFIDFRWFLFVFL